MENKKEINFNQILKQKREDKFGIKYPCACKFQCSFDNPEKPDCDNCTRCGTDGRDAYRSESDVKHYEENYA